MREILIDLTADDTSAYYRFAGYEGEHNATELTVLLPERLTGKEGAEYRFLFETAASEAVFSAPIPLQGDSLSVKLTKQLMRAPILKAFVGCYVLREGEVVLAAKSSEILLGIQKSVSEEGGEFSEEGGTVPGLVIEDSVINSKNPVTSAAILDALSKKIDRFELGSVLPESHKASSQKPVSEKAVADALEKKINRNELSSVLPTSQQSSSQKPVSEKAVTDALEKKINRNELSSVLPTSQQASSQKPVSEKAVTDALDSFLKKENYVVDDKLSAEGENPVAGGSISSVVAPAVKRAVSGEVVIVNDVSPLPQKIKVLAYAREFQYERGELVTESNFAQHDIETVSPVFLEVSKAEDDTVTFQDGRFWEGSGQLLENAFGKLSEVFSKGDFACVMNTGNGSGLFKAKAVEGLIPVGNGVVRKYGKNLCAVENWICHSTNGMTANVRLDAPPHGTYTFSAYVTKYPEDTSTNTRTKVVVYYKDGTRDLRMGTFDENSSESDGITRLKTLTFTTDSTKELSHFLMTALDYSVPGVRNQKAEKVQLEYASAHSEFVPYVEPVTASIDQNGEAFFNLSGEGVTLFSDQNIILSTEYNQDIGKTISRLEKAILDLGGNL